MFIDEPKSNFEPAPAGTHSRGCSCYRAIRSRLRALGKARSLRSVGRDAQGHGSRTNKGRPLQCRALHQQAPGSIIIFGGAETVFDFEICLQDPMGCG